jgi:hypothetical protein
MSITRVGSTKKFAENWENIFAPKRAKATSKKSVAKRSAAPKRGGKASAKSPTPTPTKRKTKAPPTAGTNQGPGDDAAKKSAAKHQASTGAARPKPVMQSE